MSEQIVLRCEDSLEGIFTALFDAFVCKNKMKAPYTDSISIAAGEGEMTLFAREIEVQTDAQKVQKTVYSIQSRLGYPVYDTLLHAFMPILQRSGGQQSWISGACLCTGTWIFPISLPIRLALRVMELSRKVDNELDKLLGFVRFQDLGSILVAQLAPKCNIVPLMMDHFSDRFPDENFILYDENRNLAAVHEAGTPLCSGEWRAASDSAGHMDYFAVLWKLVFATMEIQGSVTNEQCQNQLLPKWYRKYMMEWN